MLAFAVALPVHAGGGRVLADTAALPAPATEATQLTFVASADGRVKSTSPAKTYGSDLWLTVSRGKKPSDPISLSYIKFDVSGITGDVSDATLRLTAADSSSYGANVLQVLSDWTESSLAWNAAPGLVLPIRVIGAVQAVEPGVVDIDLDNSIFTQEGSYSFALGTPATESVKYSSREGSAPPKLILTVDPPDPPADDDGADDAPEPPAPKPMAKPRCRRTQHGRAGAGKRAAAKRKGAKSRKTATRSSTHKPTHRRPAQRPPGRRPPASTAKPCKVSSKKAHKAPRKARGRR